MTESSAADVLRQLATGSSGRSDTARLRDLYPTVETALAAGVSHAAILKALHDDGFTLTLKSFQSALYRLRKKASTAPALAPSVGQQAPRAPLPANPGPSAAARDRAITPEDLRKSREVDVDMKSLTKRGS
jgi:hypothetical protein